MDTIVPPQVSNRRPYRIVIFIALLLLAASIIYLVYVRTHQVSVGNSQLAQRTPTGTQVKVERSEVDTRQLPQEFPQDLPLEKNAVVTANYTAVVNETTKQATRSYESSLSLDDNFKIYRDYLQSHGWILVSQVEQSGYKSLTALKEGDTFQALISENSSSKLITIDLSVTSPLAEKK